ncbi:alpha/beta fold hydrolase [Thaumasiovibrio subtropicus]|uniref:alpha/beta fold hydrolase n=1 Tax=Thaumasiovibrio subtropicus TaxID=1891207 RepID=UPI000B34F02C|nr:alpha/beta fold hydrolase [Thaumasiovibrio subtropicus]
MQLHYKIEGKGQPILLIHGLFGSLSNLGLLARPLSEQYEVISVDLRNHGQSPKSDRHDYNMMAEDLVTLIEHLCLDQFDVIGHSMGGKVAMKLADRCPDKVRRLVVLDIAPVAYSKGRHDNVFAGLNEVSAYLNTITKRSEAESYLAMHVNDPGVRQFLLKSLKREGDRFAWQFNVQSLWNNYQHIMGWQAIEPYHGPTLFVKGQNSEYIHPEYRDATARQFPNARAHMVANTGHWLHAEKPETVHRVIQRFLNEN